MTGRRGCSGGCSIKPAPSPLNNNNKRLADQAGELQKRYQTALAEIDYMNREQKLMEAAAASARLSRHLIEKARAEIAAANPSRPAGVTARAAICGAGGADPVFSEKSTSERHRLSGS